MSDRVRFGMNWFQRPVVVMATVAIDTAAWLQARRARRARLLENERTVNGQEVTPQHQRQQLISQVERAQRTQLLALMSHFAVQRVPLEAAFNAGELPSGSKDVAKLRGPGSEESMRAQLISLIQTASPIELNALYRAAIGAQRTRATQQPLLEDDHPAPSR